MNGTIAVPLILIAAGGFSWGAVEYLKRCRLEKEIHFWSGLAVRAIIRGLKVSSDTLKAVYDIEKDVRGW